MNWLLKISQVYPFWFDGKIQCRIKNHVGQGRILIETKDHRVFEIFESEFKKRAMPTPQRNDTPKDQLCPSCGNLSPGRVCLECGADISF